MKHLACLGVDLGAESGRVLAGLWNGRRVCLREIHRFPNQPIWINSTLRWDLLRLWREIEHGLALARSQVGVEIKSVGVDTWGVDSVLLSRAGEMLFPAYHYRDGRTNGVMSGAFRKVARARIFEETGVQFLPFNTLYQLLALKRSSPELVEIADRLLMVPDFFHWCLSGEKAGEFTNATTTQLFNAQSGGWSDTLIKRFGLPRNIFPAVNPPGTVLGKLLPEVARVTGLSGVKVICPATHDTGSAVAAVPVMAREEGSWAYISSGTWSLMGVELKHAELSRQVLRHNMTNEGGVDHTFRLLKNIAGLWLVQGCRRSLELRGEKASYAQLTRQAARTPALRSLIDPDDASFANPPDMLRAIQTFCRRTRQPIPQTAGAVVRCALESLALRYQQTMEKLETITGKRIEVIHIVGGGSQNELLNQMTADACQRPVLAGPVEATVLGNVLVQARALGELGGLSQIREAIRASFPVKEFLPGSSMAARWQKARGNFKRLESSD